MPNIANCFQSCLTSRVLRFATILSITLSLVGIGGATAHGQEPAASVEAETLQNVRQVTAGFVKAGEGYFSPDGREIIYQAVPVDYPFYQIYSQPLAGESPQQISTGRGRTTCSYFSPDGRRILFASSHLDPKLAETEADARREQAEEAAEQERTGRRRRYKWVFDPHMDIFEADLDGNILNRLIDAPGYDAECAYSPDGQLIAFCSDRDGDPDIYVMNADGSDVRQLTNAPGYDGGPFISPDGRWVIFRSDRTEKDRLQIYAIGIDGKNEVQLTSDTNHVNWGPYWHPTQPYIIWGGADHSVIAQGKGPNYDLWLMRYEEVEGRLSPGKITRITDHQAADVLPVFSPDGKRLMWTSNRTADGSSQLWIADFRLPE